MRIHPSIHLFAHCTDRKITNIEATSCTFHVVCTYKVPTHFFLVIFLFVRLLQHKKLQLLGGFHICLELVDTIFTKAAWVVSLTWTLVAGVWHFQLKESWSSIVSKVGYVNIFGFNIWNQQMKAKAVDAASRYSVSAQVNKSARSLLCGEMTLNSSDRLYSCARQ